MDLLARAAELKPELLEFAVSGRFTRELGLVYSRFFPDGVITDEATSALALDHFALEYRLPGGDLLIDRFVAERPELHEAERAMVLGWKDVVEGIFEVHTVAGPAIILFNLIDELTYTAHSDLGEAAFDVLDPGMFMVGRLIPVTLDDWMISATPAVYTAEMRPQLVRAAADAVLRHPARVFRNPALLAEAWQIQAAQRRQFVEHFGSDLVVLRGEEVAARMRAFTSLEFPDHLHEEESVALIFDERDGLGYYTDFGAVEAAFADPSLVTRGRYRDAVSRYLRGDAVSPVPIRHLAARDHALASEVFATLLGRRGFTWPLDGEALLRAHKPGYFSAPRLPACTPVTGVLAELDRVVEEGLV
ncbi:MULTISPECIES: hypothetical protein [Nonomuraea]|uniref:Uncharacterized protein n=1 Tax=Nonomuraea mangrovi TaxID=2316207 RepID=A0ABW4SZJ3_9ACTN